VLWAARQAHRALARRETAPARLHSAFRKHLPRTSGNGQAPYDIQSKRYFKSQRESDGLTNVSGHHPRRLVPDVLVARHVADRGRRVVRFEGRGVVSGTHRMARGLRSSTSSRVLPRAWVNLRGRILTMRDTDRSVSRPSAPCHRARARGENLA